MKRREFIGLGLGLAVAPSIVGRTAWAADAKKAITDKDILKEGMPASIANYCEQPTKQPNKACPGAKDKPGDCKSCMFYNKDKSETQFKGKTYARCQLLTDPSKPQFVVSTGWCATFVKQP